MKKFLTHALSAATILSWCATLNPHQITQKEINKKVYFLLENTKIKQWWKELKWIEPVNVWWNTISFVKKNTNLPWYTRIICNPNKKEEKFEMHYKNTNNSLWMNLSEWEIREICNNTAKLVYRIFSDKKSKGKFEGNPFNTIFYKY